MSMLSKEEFLQYIEFIQKKQNQQDDLVKAFENMCTGFYCDTLVYNDYEIMLVNLLEKMFNDTSELITYKLYEFDELNEADKQKQIQETPEVATWESVYNYLISSRKA